MPKPPIIVEPFDPTNRPGARSFFEFGEPLKVISPYLNADGTPNPDSITKTTVPNVSHPNPSYIPKEHARPLDATINTASPTLEPLHGLHSEDFDQLISQRGENPELHGYDPKRFLRIREFFLRVALKDDDAIEEKRQKTELLTAQVWNEAASGSVSRSPYGTGPVHETEWYGAKGQPDLKLMKKHSRARWVSAGVSGHGGIARLQKKAKVVANAEQQPDARAVERGRRNSDTSRNARNNENFLEKTTHHVHHANHEIIDRVIGTEEAYTLKNPIKKVGGIIRNRGKLGNQLRIERENNIRKQKIDRLVRAQVARQAARTTTTTPATPRTFPPPTTPPMPPPRHP